MFETLYCHIGSHKTATTSIQRSLLASPSVLSDAGYWFVAERAHVLTHFAANPARIHPDMVRRRGREEVDRLGLAAVAGMEAAAESSAVQHAIFSTEEALFLSAAEVAEMAVFFKRLSRRVVIIYYVRHPLSRLPSVLTEAVKSAGGRLGMGLERMVEDYRSVLAPWIASFGNEALDVRSFVPDTMPEGSPVCDFCHAIEAPSLYPKLDVVRENDGLSAAAVMIKSALNGTGAVQGHDKALVDLLAEIEGPKLGLSAADIAPLRPRIEENLAYLEATFGITLPEPELRPVEMNRNIIFDDQALASIGKALLGSVEETRELRKRFWALKQAHKRLKDRSG